MGFQGFISNEITVSQPQKKPRGRELTFPENRANHTISSIMIRMEYAIGGVKR